MPSIHAVLFGVIASLNLEVEQMDLKNVFLHRDLDRNLYGAARGFQKKRKRRLCAKVEEKSLVIETDSKTIV